MGRETGGAESSVEEMNPCGRELNMAMAFLVWETYWPLLPCCTTDALWSFSSSKN